jgi:hypothetical protein
MKLIVIFNFYWKNCLLTIERKVRTMSSLDGPYGLGYTGATMIITKGSNNVSWSKSLKVI